MRSFICRSRRTSVFISSTARPESACAVATKVVVVGDEALGIRQRPDGGGARPGVDQAHLAEDLAGPQRLDGLGRGTGADAHLDRARDDEKGGVAGLALGEDRLPRP